MLCFQKTGGLDGRNSILYEMQTKKRNGENRRSDHEKRTQSPQRQMLCLWDWNVQNSWQVAEKSKLPRLRARFLFNYFFWGREGHAVVNPSVHDVNQKHSVKWSVTCGACPKFLWGERGPAPVNPSIYDVNQKHSLNWSVSSGARGGRTLKMSPSTDFKSVASAYSAIAPAVLSILSQS
jgi:hypothetical protein